MEIELKVKLDSHLMIGVRYATLVICRIRHHLIRFLRDYIKKGQPNI